VSQEWCLEKESQSQRAFEEHAYDQHMMGSYDVYRYYAWNMNIHYRTQHWVTN
jgi:hypothetical protein